MKAGVFAAAAVLMLAACGQGAEGPTDRELLVRACVAEGEAEETCNCIANAMEQNLSAGLYSKTAKAVGQDGQDMMTFVGDLTMEEQLAFNAVLGDMFACSLAGQSG